MTDNEIFKDLECCSERGNCNRCSRYTIPYPTCKEQLCKSACNLIHILSNNADNAFQEGLNENRELFKSEIEAEIFNKVTEDLEALKGYISIGYTPRYARELWERIDSFFEKHLPEYATAVSKCQQNKDLPCNIGDTAYCVNGYGSNKHIETFTVAEIIIRKEGIYLKDTNDMEWLARVCHFSRKSAERELNPSSVVLPVEVGDTVFLPYITDYETIEQYEVIEVGQDENGLFFRVNDEEGNKIHDHEIGTTVFLTHKEAVEKALQMIGGNKTGNFLYNRFMKTE